MSIGFPLGFAALAAIAPLLAAYFLRRRQKPRTVSALFLWKSPSQRAQAGPRFERFSREASLALEILAVLCAAFFLADVRFGKSAIQKHVVVVVDGGLSMSAKDGNTLLADKAREEVARIVRSEGATLLTVVETGVKPTVLAGPQLEAARAMSALEKWKPLQPAHDFGPALLMAKELAGERHRLFFLTDGPLAEGASVAPEVQVKSIGVRATNFAFLSAQRQDASGAAAITVRVGNFSDETKKLPIKFVAKDGAENTQELELKAGASGVVRVGMKTLTDVEVSLPPDALDADSHLTMLPAPVQPLSVAVLEGLDSTAASSVRHFLAVAPGLNTASETPAELTFGATGSAARVTFGTKGALKSFVGPFFSSKGHPLLDDVQLGGVVWTAGENQSGRALVSAGNVVLVSEEDDGAIHFNLELSRSNLHRTSAWPVWLGNIVRESRLKVAGLPRRHLMLGEEVAVVTRPGSTWALKGPQGQSRTVFGAGAVTLPALEAPGRWSLLENGKEIDALGVLPVDPRESDLRTRGAFSVDASRDAALAGLLSDQPRSLWPLALLLLLLMIDFWLTARGAVAPSPVAGRTR